MMILKKKIWTSCKPGFLLTNTHRIKFTLQLSIYVYLHYQMVSNFSKLNTHYALCQQIAQKAVIHIKLISFKNHDIFYIVKGILHCNIFQCNKWCKGNAVPLQAWSGPEGSRKLRFPDYMTTARDGGKVVSLMHRPPLPQEMLLVLISVRGWVDPRAIVHSEGFYVNEKSRHQLGSNQRPSDL